MSSGMKKMVIASMAVAGLVGLLAIVDMILGLPFANQVTMDVMFILGAGRGGYMGYDTLSE